METSKLGFYLTNNCEFTERVKRNLAEQTASTRSGSNAIFDYVRPAPRTRSCSLNKSDIPNRCHADVSPF